MSKDTNDRNVGTCPSCLAPHSYHTSGSFLNCESCGSYVGHPPNCPCLDCQDWRDAKFGMELLGDLKAMKAKYPEKASSQSKTTIVISYANPTCRSCDKEIRHDDRFCVYCGTQQICFNCNCKLNKDDLFCTKCGVQVPIYD